jgi:hypothetical protein
MFGKFSKLLKFVPGVFLLTSPLTASAQDTVSREEVEGIVNQAIAKVSSRVSDHLKFGGFIQGQALYSSDKDNYGGFSLRRLRLYLHGDITPAFGYRMQTEMVGSSPRLLDAWLEWKQYKYFRIRAGQMHRNFAFEVPWSPVTLGVPDYSQAVIKLAGITDRAYTSTTDAGRDIGVMLNGDLLTVGNHSLFYYALGIYNGNGINKKDDNKHKDLVGQLVAYPIKNLGIGGGYWWGKYGPEGSTVDRKRWTVGLKYDDGNYLVRGEYIASRGRKLNNDASSINADGWYLMAGVPVAKNLKLFGKYDVYRDDRTHATQTTKYVAALNWKLYKYIILQGSYFYQQNPDGQKNTNNVCAQFIVSF